MCAGASRSLPVEPARPLMARGLSPALLSFFVYCTFCNYRVENFGSENDGGNVPFSENYYSTKVFLKRCKDQQRKFKLSQTLTKEFFKELYEYPQRIFHDTVAKVLIATLHSDGNE
jgi:hypothetical protein